MPFLEDSEAAPINLSNRHDVPKGFAVTPGAEDLNDTGDKPAWNWGAAFRRNNEMAALAASNSFWQGNEAESGFNPWDKIKGTPDEANFAALSEARNERKFNAIKSDIARENADRKLLDSQPWWMGLITEGSAGILSPTTFLPGGQFVKGAKGGIAVAKAAASVGAANAVATGIQEGALHGIEQTRTAGESATAIGASLFLGGLLGAGGQALLSKADWQKGVQGLEHDVAGVRTFADAKPVFDDVYSQLKATGMADEEARVNASVFAARYATRAERLGEGATPLDAYRADGLEIRSGEGGDAAEGVGVFNQSAEVVAREKATLDKMMEDLKADPSIADAAFEQMAKLGQSKDDWAKVLGAEPGGIELASSNSRNKLTAAVTRSQEKPGGWRVTYFDDRGFSGHTEYKTKEQAVNAALDEGYTVPANGSLRKAMEAKTFFQKSSPAAATDTPEFKNWFGDSKVVDENGEPKVMYHGSGHQIDEFDTNRGAKTTGNVTAVWGSFFTPSPGEASRYAEMFHKDGQNITPVYLSIKQPFEMTRREWDTHAMQVFRKEATQEQAIANEKQFRESLQRDGYDGIIINGRGFNSEYVVFDPKQIKSSIGNNGKFDPNDPRIHHQDAADPRGKITVLKDNSAVINLFKNADESTFMHEAGHLWLGELTRDAAKNAKIKTDLDATLKWLGVDDASKITLKEHEQWARGFEEYLREGKAPSAGLARAFDAFKQWLTTIYQSIAKLGPDHVAINDDIRSVMDRLLATDREIAARDSGSVGGPHSVGAAANDATSIGDNTIAGAMARGVAASTAKLNPLLRALHSPSAAYRDIMTNMVENPLYLTKNFEGVASSPAAETFMKEYNGGLAAALKTTNSGYLEYRKAGGQLAKDEFRDAVGKAMRRGDQDADPVIARTAQEWRAKVFDPLKEAAIKAGLLPADVSVTTAPSYFTRMWNGRKISGDERGFKEMVQDWAEKQIPGWAQQFDKTAERRLNPMRQEIAAQEMAKLRRAEELKQRREGGEIEAGGPGEMTEADIRQALRIVDGKAPKPKGVKTLSQFVVEQGGLVDDAGELAHRGITNKARPGMIRKERRTEMSKKGGWTLDDMARHAWENDYFPDNHQRPSIDEFVEALNDDFSKTRAVLKKGDEDAYRLTELVDQLEADLSRAGVKADGKAPRFSTSEEMKGAVERVYKALDAEADRKISSLKEKLAEREADIRVDRESRFLGDPKELGKSIADEVFDTLTGRSGGIRPEFLTIKARGPLKERTFNIEDLFQGTNGRAVEDYLEHDVEQVGRRYTRIMGADVELARKFGSVDMVDQITKIRDDYRNLRAGITDEKQLTALAKREKDDISDLEAVRDMLRGTNPGAPVDANYSRIVRAVNHFNYLRSMGEVALASLTETVRPAMVHGLMPYMEMLGQTLTNLKGVKASVKEANLAGNVHEGVLGGRMATISEIIDPYTSRGPVEAFLENMTNIASKWNGIRMLTDMQKSAAAILSQNRLLENSTRFAEAPAKEKAYLAYMGIDQSMAERIAKQFDEHGEVSQKVLVANTEKWTDEVARRTFRAAMNKDIDSIITTKGVADTPLFANTPTGRAMLQFKSFALASHQRVLLRGLQEDQARFVGGLIAMTTIGMMATWLKAMSGNRAEKLQDASKNPGWWIAEGFDKAGIFAIPVELANTFEKATGFNPIKTPMKAFDEGSAISQKNQNRSLLGSVVGPTGGLIDDATQVMGLPKKMIAGEEITQEQKNAAERLLPFNSYAGIRQMLRYVVNPQAPQ